MCQVYTYLYHLGFYAVSSREAGPASSKSTITKADKNLQNDEVKETGNSIGFVFLDIESGDLSIDKAIHVISNTVSYCDPDSILNV